MSFAYNAQPPQYGHTVAPSQFNVNTQQQQQNNLQNLPTQNAQTTDHQHYTNNPEQQASTSQMHSFSHQNIQPAIHSNSTPIHSTPIQSTPMHSAPMHSTPIQSTPMMPMSYTTANNYTPNYQNTNNNNTTSSLNNDNQNSTTNNNLQEGQPLQVVNYSETDIKVDVATVLTKFCRKDYDEFLTMKIFDPENLPTDEFYLNLMFLFKPFLKRHLTAAHFLVKVYLSLYGPLMSRNSFIQTWMYFSIISVYVSSLAKLKEFSSGAVSESPNYTDKGIARNIQTVDEPVLHPFLKTNEFKNYMSLYNIGKEIASFLIPIQFAPFEVSFSISKIRQKYGEKASKDTVSSVSCIYNKTIFSKITDADPAEHKFKYYQSTEADDLVRLVTECVQKDPMHKSTFGVSPITNQKCRSILSETIEDCTKTLKENVYAIFFKRNECKFFNNDKFKMQLFSKMYYYLPENLLKDSSEILNDSKESFMREYQENYKILKDHYTSLDRLKEFTAEFSEIEEETWKKLIF